MFVSGIWRRRGAARKCEMPRKRLETVVLGLAAIVQVPERITGHAAYCQPNQV